MKEPNPRQKLLDKKNELYILIYYDQKISYAVSGEQLKIRCKYHIQLHENLFKYLNKMDNFPKIQIKENDSRKRQNSRKTNNPRKMESIIKNLPSLKDSTPRQFYMSFAKHSSII